MTSYYRPQRSKNLYLPKSKTPFRLSRSKIDLFMNCPRCFYFDRRLGVGQPPGFPFSLNSAVDMLLKKEFDVRRAQGQPHPLMKDYGIDAIPFEHEQLDEWRDALGGGMTYLHPPTNFLVAGAIDDVWMKSSGELMIVDYKATAKKGEVTLDADWQQGYKRQMEMYQWLFRKNGYQVDSTGYFVYCNGRTDRQAFDARLEFTIKLIPYLGNDSWVEQALKDIKACLNSEQLPPASPECAFCAYRGATQKHETQGIRPKIKHATLRR